MQKFEEKLSASKKSNNAQGLPLHGPSKSVVWLRSSKNGSTTETRHHVPLSPTRPDEYPTFDLNSPALAAQIVPAIVDHARGLEARTGSRSLRHSVEQSVNECLGREFGTYLTHRAEKFYSIKRSLLANHQITNPESRTTGCDPGSSLSGLKVAHDFLWELVSHFSMYRDAFERSSREHKPYERQYLDGLSGFRYIGTIAHELKLFVCQGECPKIDTFMANAQCVAQVGEHLKSIVRASHERQDLFHELASQSWGISDTSVKALYELTCNERKNHDHQLIVAALGAASKLLTDIRATAFSFSVEKLVEKFEGAVQRYLSNTLDTLGEKLIPFHQKQNVASPSLLRSRATEVAE